MNRNLVSLSLSDQLVLSPEELKQLTATSRPSEQIEWLRANGWVFMLTKAGRPVVGRMHADLKLAGIDLVSPVQSGPWQPNLNAIQ